jgi:predicted AlkP superfamily pyrophosphatase or phosphodiesterase
VPSLLSSLGVGGFANPLAIEAASRVCFLLVDGLGWELLRANQGAAPFMNSITRAPLTAGFPATTAASLSSLGLGVTPGEHGLIGYTMALPGHSRAFNTLTWALYGIGPRVSLLEEVVPETFQPLPTLAERAAAASLPIHHLGPGFHEWSGLTRAIGRGERFHPANSLEAVGDGALRLLNAPRTFVFGYHPRLDAAGHVNGVASQAWKDELVAVDHGVRLLAEQLPPDTLLVISGDHGMVDLRPEERLDLADHPDLKVGVRMLSGEARARYVSTEPGATADVVSAWRSKLGDRMWVWTKDEAIAIGIFGPQVSDRARERIGDIVAAAYGRVGIVERNVDPAQARLIGHHGSLTPAEQLVPLLVYRS